MGTLKEKLEEFEKQIVGIANDDDLQKKFEELAKELINNFYIKCDKKEYFFAEIEFYYYDKVNFNKEWNWETYPRNDKDAGDLFFHYSGVDICFDSHFKDGRFGGILIRSLYDKDINRYITGPTVCSNEILNSCSKSLPEIKYKEEVFQCDVEPIKRYGIQQYGNEELCFYDSRLLNRCYNKFEKVKWDFDKKNKGENPKLTDYPRTYSRFK